jgi:osmoprotectant transport system permease protein
MTRPAAKLYNIAIILLAFCGGVALEKTGTIAFLTDPYNYHDLMRLLFQHFYLVAISMAMATALGLIIGITLTRPKFKRYCGIVMYIVGLGQTIPSLAVLALVMSFLGIGTKPAIFALTVYSILPIARNTLAGIRAVPVSTLDAAKGMGMTSTGILIQVELPMAMKVILTGFRVALVINIGTVALAYLIGAGGMGDWIFSGIDMMMTDKLLAGAIPVTLMALLADFLVELLSAVLVSRGLRLSEE